MRMAKEVHYAKQLECYERHSLLRRIHALTLSALYKINPDGCHVYDEDYVYEDKDVERAVSIHTVCRKEKNMTGNYSSLTAEITLPERLSFYNWEEVFMPQSLADLFLACILQSAKGYKREDTPSCISFSRVKIEDLIDTFKDVTHDPVNLNLAVENFSPLIHVAENTILKISKETAKGVISLKTSMFPGFVLNTDEYLFVSDLSYTLTRPFAFIQMDIPAAEVQGMGGSPLYTI